MTKLTVNFDETEISQIRGKTEELVSHLKFNIGQRKAQLERCDRECIDLVELFFFSENLLQHLMFTYDFDSAVANKINIVLQQFQLIDPEIKILYNDYKNDSINQNNIKYRISVLVNNNYRLMLNLVYFVFSKTNILEYEPDTVYNTVKKELVTDVNKFGF